MLEKETFRNMYLTAADKELLERLRDNDREAFSCIYRRYYAPLYTLAMRYVKNASDVEDILQQVFVKLWTIREALLVTSELRGYLYAMTKHHVMNHIRNSNSALQHNYKISQQHPLYDDDLYMYAERHARSEQLEYAIDKLPTQQKKVAMMRCQGYSNQEIAKRLNLSIHTVNTHYRECLKTLRTHLLNIVKLSIIHFILHS